MYGLWLKGRGALFYIEINRGAPSYNMGSMYARMSIHGDSATFYTPMDYADTGCEWTLVFTKSNLRISTLNGQFDCGFGHAVYADGNYRRKSRKIPRYFESIEREIIYFDKTRPEDF